MAKYYYGCDEVTKGWPRYFQLCTALEVVHGGKPPTIKTLNTWRVESPKGFAFIMHAVPELSAALVALAASGKSVIDDTVRDAWEQTEARANALAAKAVILHTPFDFMPSESARALISHFGDELAAKSKRVVIWESEGVWPPEESSGLARDHGMLYLTDPFIAHEEERDLGKGDLALEITERGGMRRTFDQFDFEDLLDWTEKNERVFLLMRGQYQWRHAREIQQVFNENE